MGSSGGEDDDEEEGRVEGQDRKVRGAAAARQARVGHEEGKLSCVCFTR